MSEYTQTIHQMGTKITLYYKGDNSKAIVKEACSLLIRYEQIFSANSDTSQLALLKQSAGLYPQIVDSELYELIKIGKQHSCDSKSFLNIAIGPLIKLWRIGFKEARIPEKDEINQILDQLDPHSIVLNDANKSVYLEKKGMEIDLGAIAKGYFSDKIMAFFKRHKPQSAMIDIGGNVLVYGDSPSDKDKWTVGIQNPSLPRGHCVAALSIHNQSVVTSGVYERHYEKDGKSFHHIFDTRTGYPIDSNLASLTIIADTSLDCDVYTTKLFALDIKTIFQTVTSLPGMSAIVITLDGQMAYTDNLRDKIQLLN